MLVSPGNVIDLCSAADGDAAHLPADLFSPAQARRLRQLPQADEVWHVAVKRLRCFVQTPPAGALPEPSRPRALIVACLCPAVVLACASCPPEPDLASATARGVSASDIVEHLARCIAAPRKPAGAGNAGAVAGAPAAAAASASSSASPSAGVGAEAGAVAASPHRPRTVTFEDPALALGCRASLLSVGIDTKLLRNPPRKIVPFVLALAQTLISRGLAGIIRGNPFAGHAPIADGSGAGGMTVDHVRALLGMARRFAAEGLWNTLSDRQVFRVRMESAGAGDGRAEPLVGWVSVMGGDALKMRKRIFEESGGNMEAAMSVPVECGIRVFFKRFDAEQRLLSAPRSREQPAPPLVEDAEPNLADLQCARCGLTVHDVANERLERTGGNPSPDDFEAALRAGIDAFVRCEKCREVYYCKDGPRPAGGPASAAARQCQKEHAHQHKDRCEARKSTPWLPPEVAARLNRPPGYWPDSELVCFFKKPFEMPFADLELFDRLSHVGTGGADLPLLWRPGPRRPNAGETLWLMRAMAAVLEFGRARPDRFNDMFTHVDLEERLELAGSAPVAAQQPSHSFTDAKSSGTRTFSRGGDPSGRPIQPRLPLLDQMQLELDLARMRPWFEAFGESAPPIAFVRADAILRTSEFAELEQEVFELAEASHDPAAVKAGLYVPSRVDPGLLV